MNTKPTDQRPLAKSPVRRLRGFGDVIHAVAWPVAVVIDKTSNALGHPTNIQNCGGCKKRREDLNNALPFVKEDSEQR
jgi:hypothetical protein